MVKMQGKKTKNEKDININSEVFNAAEKNAAENQAEQQAGQTEVTVEDTENIKEDTAEKKYAELMDKYLLSVADFDNFRKRTVKEKAGMYSNGVCDTVAKILPVVDNFERALTAVENKDDSFYKGLDMILRQLMAAFDDLGVKVIEAAGNSFDPNLHSAVAHVEDANYDSNIVIEELQKGYRLNDKIIRHSMVKVAN